MQMPPHLLPRCRGACSFRLLLGAPLLTRGGCRAVEPGAESGACQDAALAAQGCRDTRLCPAGVHPRSRSRSCSACLSPFLPGFSTRPIGSAGSARPSARPSPRPLAHFLLRKFASRGQGHAGPGWAPAAAPPSPRARLPAGLAAPGLRPAAPGGRGGPRKPSWRRRGREPQDEAGEVKAAAVSGSSPPFAMRPRRFYISIKDFAGGVEVWVPQGTLLSQAAPLEEAPSRDPTFRAQVLDTEEMVKVPSKAVLELSETYARLLQAVTNGEERLGLFKQEELLRRLSVLRRGDQVRVQITSASGEKVRGVVRYRGPVSKNRDEAGIIFGVELVGSAAGKGFTDGSFKDQKFFSCRENCGVFVPVSRIEPDEGSPPRPRWGSSKARNRLQQVEDDPLRSPSLELGDRVFFNMDDSRPTGTVMFCDYLPEKEHAGIFVGIHLDQPIGSWDGVFKGHALCHFPSPEHGLLLPISKVYKEKIEHNPKASIDNPSLGFPEDPPCSPSIRYPPRIEQHSPKGPPASLTSIFVDKDKGEKEKEPEENDEEKTLVIPLEIYSMVEVHDPPIYGVIRWIGNLPEVGETIAGLELEEPLASSCTDGSYRGTRYFQCPPDKGFFVKLRHCRPDSRFGVPQPLENPVLRCNSLDFRIYASERVLENTPPALGEEGGQRLTGWKKGIQGHCNSCYLDATLFCMFTFSSVLDSLLLRPADKNDGESYVETRDLLRTEIVNPLRKHGYVCATKVMSLRRVLEAAGSSPGFTCEEKDPEEFLTLLFRVLKGEPLFNIRSADKDPQGCIFYQIFMEGALPGVTQGVPTVQQLLEGSLATGDLKFTEAPSCLILQMPRNGKDFKAFATILPSLQLDLTDLLEDAPRECCICQELAVSECPQCYGDPHITAGSTRQYCSVCCQQVHRHRARSSHHPRLLRLPPELSHLPPLPVPLPRQTMQLYAVLCIQTSHYVAFVRHGPRPEHWLFFDSMADRQGGQNGFNIPRVTPCPEVADYLEMSPKELQALDPKSLPPCARRLLCDAYMCLYHNTALGFYK
ncbi:ubiquitin carboxyl-terminal hydrolase CYLD isoform X2 [Alligator mississippiensis]|uniref:ubiquitin carboxyl-terminal hydrolase CYLD isoform X2 n=1 Tax=Alligator mississippiensis TaxID=8496 RepID=UPI0028780E1F|nr:ubiquitin carboxyl-terminal hydrolase CYLD isoform X2 [Alligator mississippiensis]